MGSKGGGGGGGTVSNPQNSINYAAPPPQLSDAYSQLITRAQGIANQPLQQYGGQMVADFNPTQQQAFGQVQNYAGAAQPGIQQGMQLAAQSADPTLGKIPGATQSLMNPYLQSAVSATQANMDETNAQQQNQLRGHAIGAGAYGGDRAGVASAALSRQQNLANNQVLAGMQNAGYQQAQSAAMNSLSGDAARQANAGFELGQLGTSGQTAGLQGANALLQTGGMQQQLAQQQLNVPYQQFVQQQAYPYQSTQWLASLLGGAGAGMGGTATTTYPGQDPYAMYGGLGLAGLGLAGSYSDSSHGAAGAARGGRIGLAGGGLADVDFSNAAAMMPKVERIGTYVPDAKIEGRSGLPSAPGGSHGSSQVAGMSATDLAGAGKSARQVVDALLKKDKTDKKGDGKGESGDISKDEVNGEGGSGGGTADGAYGHTADDWMLAGESPLASVEGGGGFGGSEGGGGGGLGSVLNAGDAGSLAGDAAGLAGAAEAGIGAAEGTAALDAILAAGEFAKRGGRIHRLDGGGLETPNSIDGIPNVADQTSAMFSGSGGGSRGATSIPHAIGGTGADIARSTEGASSSGGGIGDILKVALPIAAMFMMNRGGRATHAGGGRVERAAGGNLVDTVTNPLGTLTGQGGDPLFNAMFGKSGTSGPNSTTPAAQTGIPAPATDNMATKPAEAQSHGGKGSDIFGILDPVGSALGISPDKLFANRGGRIDRAVGGGTPSPYAALPLSQLEYLSAVTPTGTPQAAQIDAARKSQQANAGVVMQQPQQQAAPAQPGGAMPGVGMPGAAATGMPGSYSSAGGVVSPQDYGTGFGSGGFVPRFADGGPPTLEDALPLPEAREAPIVDAIRARIAGREMTQAIRDANDRDKVTAPSAPDEYIRGSSLAIDRPPGDQPRGRRDPFSDTRGRAITNEIRALDTRRNAELPPGIPEDVNDGRGGFSLTNPSHVAQAKRRAAADEGPGGLGRLLDRTGLSAIPGIIDRGGRAASRLASPTSEDKINAAGEAGAQEFPPPEPIESRQPPSPERVEQEVGKAVIEGGADPALVGRPQDPAAGTLAPEPRLATPTPAPGVRPSLAAPAAPPAARPPLVGPVRPAAPALPSAALPAVVKVAEAVKDAVTAKPDEKKADEKTEGLEGASRYKPKEFVAAKRDPRGNFWDAITNMGLGMMTSRNPNFLGALGEGGLRGVATLANAKKDADTSEEKAHKLHADTEKYHQEFAAKEQEAVKRTEHEKRMLTAQDRMGERAATAAANAAAAAERRDTIAMQHWQMQHAAQMAQIAATGARGNWEERDVDVPDPNDPSKTIRKTMLFDRNTRKYEDAPDGIRVVGRPGTQKVPADVQKVNEWVAKGMTREDAWDLVHTTVHNPAQQQRILAANRAAIVRQMAADPRIKLTKEQIDAQALEQYKSDAAELHAFHVASRPQLQGAAQATAAPANEAPRQRPANAPSDAQQAPNGNWYSWDKEKSAYREW